MGQIVDFSDLAHVRKILKSETVETVDGIEWGLEYVEERAPVQLMTAIKTQDSAFIITEAATILSVLRDRVRRCGIVIPDGCRQEAHKRRGSYE
jgi:hypothetical protein